MAININSVKELCYDLAAKQQQAFPSPAEFNAYCNLAQNDLFNYYNDEREKMLLKVKAGQTLFMPSTLTAFIENKVALSAPSGTVTAPSGYIYDQSLTTPEDINIKKVDNERLPAYLNSTIDNPTADNPIYVELSNTFQVYPTISPVLLTYLRMPNPVLWAYTLSPRPTYDPTNSIDFEWLPTEATRLISRILMYMGVSIRDNELVQIAEQMKITAS